MDRRECAGAVDGSQKQRRAAQPLWYSEAVDPMRWLVAALLVSLCALLLAAAAVARHILRQHRLLREGAPEASEAAKEIDAEPGP